MWRDADPLSIGPAMLKIAPSRSGVSPVLSVGCRNVPQ